MNRKEKKKNFYSFQSTNLAKARFTEIGLLTRGMPLHLHLNIHVVHPIIKRKVYRAHLSNPVFLWTPIDWHRRGLPVIYYRASRAPNITSQHVCTNYSRYKGFLFSFYCEWRNPHWAMYWESGCKKSRVHKEEFEGSELINYLTTWFSLLAL